MQVLDQTVINELREMLGDEVDELLAELLQQAAQQMASMQHALLAGDLHSLEHIAHQLKGSASNLGVSALADVCRQLEQGLRRDAAFDAGEQLSLLEHAYAEAAAAIQSVSKR